MPVIIEGHLNGNNKKVAIIVSRFNSFIVERLIEGSVDGLIRHGVSDADIKIYKITGAFEFAGFLAQFIEKKSKEFDGIVCLGAIIRGETPHFNYVAAEATKSIAHLSLKADIPISFGILTTDTLEQAVNRAGAKSGNKGYECSLGLLEMMDMYNKL